MKRSGFTLIEVLAVVAISSLLLVGLFLLQARLLLYKDEAQAIGRDYYRQATIESLFAEDYSQCWYVAVGENEIILNGFGGNSLTQNDRRQLAASIRYYVDKSGVLRRTETALDPNSIAYRANLKRETAIAGNVRVLELHFFDQKVGRWRKYAVKQQTPDLMAPALVKVVALSTGRTGDEIVLMNRVCVRHGFELE